MVIMLHIVLMVLMVVTVLIVLMVVMVRMALIVHTAVMDLMDLTDQKASQLQETMIALINHRYSFPEVYNPQEQLLSVYFHEDWVIEADHQHVKKKVKGITPVIWQQRQTAEGEPLHDAATGYPVYYKLKLERIELRQP